MNAWLRQIHTKNPLYVPGPICDEHGLKDGDWVFLISNHGRIKVEIARMEAVNSSTHLDVERDRQAQGRMGARPGCRRKPEKAS